MNIQIIRKSFCLAFLLVILLLRQAYSRNIVAADLTYVHISDQTYDVILTVYSECKPNEIISNGYQVDYQSVTCNVQKKVNVLLQGQGKVISACGNTLTRCQGGIGLGFIKAVYKGRINLKDESTDGKCNDWVFSWQDCTRSNEITNIKSPETKCLALQSKLNNKDFTANDSPTFPIDPVAFLTLGTEAIINPNTVEKNKDVLKYSLINPKDKQTTDVEYISPFSASKPLSSSTGFSFSDQTGELRFTPSKANERTVFALLIEEFRDGKLVGSVVRDLQIAVQDGKNAAPTLSGLSNTTLTDTTVNTGRQFCFNLFGSDPDPGQILTVTVGNAPAGHTLTGTRGVKPVTRFCWTPRDADEGQRKLIFTIKDDACPQLSFDREIIVNVRKVSKECENLSAFFSKDTVCLGKKTKFTDFSSPSNTIVSWNWDFGNGMTHNSTTLANRNPEVKQYYDKPGIYTVKLSITDKNKCSTDAKILVRVCETPKAGFEIKSFDKEDPTKEIESLCSNQPFLFNDTTKSPCTISKRFWFANGKQIGIGKSPFYTGDAGAYAITLKAYTNENCEASVTKQIDIKQGPKLEVFGTYHFKCTDFDTLVTLKGIGGTPLDGNSYSYKWIAEAEKGEATISPAANLQTVTIKYPDNTNTTVRAIVKDKNSCAADSIVKIINPLVLNYSNSPYCNPEDSVRFDVGVSHDSLDGSLKSFARWGLKSFVINYGDNTSSNQLLSKHKYAQDGVYEVLTRVEDNSSCVREFKKSVFIKLPNFRFEIDKDTVCFNGSTVKFLGPFYTGQAPEQTFAWTADSLTKVLVDTINTSSNSGEYTPKFQGNGFIKLAYTYNEACNKEFETPLFVYPLSEATIDSNLTRSCAGVNTIFKTSTKVGSNPIDKYNWQFFEVINNATTLIKESTEREPSIFLNKPGVYRALLSTIDNKTCPNTQSPFLFRADSVVIPCFTFTGACVSEKIFFLKDCTIPRENILNPISYKWEVSDGFTTDVANPFHYFPKAGKYSIKATFFSGLNGQGCNSSFTNELTILPQPIADFENDTACFGLPLNFVGKGQPSSLPGDTLKAYRWLFDNKNGTVDTVSGKNVSYVFKNFSEDANTGLEARYIVTNSFNCSDTLSKIVTVYPKPKANFSYDFVDDQLTSSKPILFEGLYNSSNPETSSQDVINWQYKFGDGNQSNGSNGNVTHTYASVAKYDVQLIVTNAKGCTDTILKQLDLNAYLVVPNTITPNNDNAGDDFEIISKGVVKINQYKIYNRWGEVIFDGGADKNAKWDGKYNGAEQPMGVYVYYVSGTTMYGEEISIKGNLTLIR